LVFKEVRLRSFKEVDQGFFSLWRYMLMTLLVLSALMATAIFSVKAQEANLPVETVEGLFTQVVTFIKGFGGLSWMSKVAGITAILISTMKVSVVRKYTWDRLGGLKVWLAPALGLVFGIFSLGSDLSFASGLAYVSAGAGAIILHELLDSLKELPKIGKAWTTIIGVIEMILGKSSPT
jgi:hypothetical protein